MIEQEKNNMRFIPTITKSRDRIENLEIDEGKWNGLKEMVQEFSVSYSWWLTISLTFFSSALTIGLTFISIIQSNNPYKNILENIFWVTLFIGFALLISFFINRKNFLSDKHKILREMSRMEPKSIKDEDVLLERMPAWIATTQKNVVQGIEYRKQTLFNKSLKYLSFKVSSSSIFWRAGLKLDLPNNEEMPHLVTPQSFLFHVGLDNGKSIIYVYKDGNTSPIIRDHLNIEKLDPYSPMLIQFKIENNIINCFINDKAIYQTELDPSFFRKFYLAAWGDTHNYEVEFNEIEFRAE